MKTVLDTGNTWFLESFTQGPYSRLVIRLAEGVASAQPTEITLAAGVKVGPVCATKVAPELRVVEIVFSDPLAFFTRREEFDSLNGLEFEEQNSYIRLVAHSALQDFARNATGIYSGWREGIREYHVWTEEQIFQVFSCEPPEVVVTPDRPDQTIKRGEIWVHQGSR